MYFVLKPGKMSLLKRAQNGHPAEAYSTTVTLACGLPRLISSAVTAGAAACCWQAVKVRAASARSDTVRAGLKRSIWSSRPNLSSRRIQGPSQSQGRPRGFIPGRSTVPFLTLISPSGSSHPRRRPGGTCCNQGASRSCWLRSWGSKVMNQRDAFRSTRVRRSPPPGPGSAEPTRPARHGDGEDRCSDHRRSQAHDSKLDLAVRPPPGLRGHGGMGASVVVWRVALPRGVILLNPNRLISRW